MAETTKTETEKTGHKRSETAPKTGTSTQAKEYGGPQGPEPTRYGDWEKKGRCIDF